MDAAMKCGRNIYSAAAVVVGCLLAMPAFTASAATKKQDVDFEGWRVKCNEGSGQCVAFTTSKGAQLLIGERKDKKNALETLLAIHIPAKAQKGDPIALHLDSDITLQVKVWDCNKIYCEAQVNPDAVPSVIPRLIADNKGLIIYRLDGNILVVPVSLVDFSKALKAVRD